MPKFRIFRHPILLLVLLLTLQSCTCMGIEIGSYFPGSSQGSAQGLPSGMNCSAVNLSSPRDSLPNGPVTVYWKPLAGAVNYKINIYSGNAIVKTWEAASPATNLQIDVSEAAIGGSNPFQLELLVFDANGNYCRDYVVINREGGPQAVVDATATPTATPFPSILAGNVSYCVPSRDYYYVNLPLSAGTDPDFVYNELIVTKSLSVKIGAGITSCVVNKGTIPVLTCTIPATTTFPAEVLVQYNGATVQTFSYDGYCPNEQENNDPPKEDPTPPPLD